MKLSQYIDAKKLTAAAFGREIGRSRSFVLRLIKGERLPSMTLAEEITRATGGEVSATDFYKAPLTNVAEMATEVKARDVG